MQYTNGLRISCRMKGKIPRRRIIGMVIAAVLLCFGSLMFPLSHIYRGSIERWHEAEALRLKVDLSKPGDYSAPFIQSCRMADGIYLYVETEKRFSTKDEAVAFVKGIRGRLSITGPNGESVLGYDFSDADINFWRLDSKSVVPVLPMRFLGKGEYVLNLIIHEPAPALADINHMLVAGYLICGLKLMPAVLLKLAGFVSIGIAVVIIIVIVLWSLKRRRRAGGSVSSEAASR